MSYGLYRFLCLNVASTTVLLLFGCAATQEGLYVGETPKIGAEALVENRQPDVAKELILIGATSAFRPFNEANIQEYYSSYEKFSAQIHPNSPPAIDFDEFRDSFSGWTNLKYFSLPIVAGFFLPIPTGLYEDALVPNGLSEQIKFPSSAGTILVQEAGDLLAARTNSDGFYIVKKILCKDVPGYFECAKQYEKGVFDGITGVELDSNLKKKAYGKVIDTKIFLVHEHPE